MLFIQRITTMARLKNAMKKVESRPFKRQLLELRARLRGDVNAMADAVFSDSGGAGAGSTSNHMADVGTEHFDQEFTLSLVENEGETIELIDHALARIEAGAYGACTECEGKIPKMRLSALPCLLYTSPSPRDRG